MSALATPASTMTPFGSPDGDDVWAWNASKLEFDRLRAVRCAPNTWEVVGVPRGSVAYDRGDLVHCELSDGELLVQSRVWSGRLL